MQSDRAKAKGMKMRVLLVAATLAVQVLALGWLIMRYERVVQQGTEVRFKCQAYDPYDPLRGRYLSMTVRETTTNVAESVGCEDFYWRVNCAVRLEPSTNGLWRVAEVAKEPGIEGIWLKPRRVNVDRPEARVSFPDQLFVNEKIAPEAEEILRKKSNDAVAVYRVLDGEIVLTDIEIGGKPILGCGRIFPF